MNIAISILALGLLIALHELGHFFAARAVGMRVLRFSVGFFHPLLSYTSKRTGIVYQLGAVPLGGFVQIQGMNPFEDDAFTDPRSYQRMSLWRRAVAIAAGPVANFLVAWVLVSGLFLVGQPVALETAELGAIVPDGPAARAGLASGDVVQSIDGKPVTTWTELASTIHDHPGQALTLVVLRGPATRTVVVRAADRDGVGMIGIGPGQRFVRLPPGEAMTTAADRCVTMIADQLRALGGLVTGTAKGVEAVGPVGIVKTAASTLDQGPREFLALTAFLSLMLFLFNLLPLPALDGGRLVFLAWELVTRRPVNRKVDAVVSTGGFILLVGLLVLITAKELFFG